MIRVTVELFSAIDGHHEILGQGFIYNDGSGTNHRGNYEVLLGRKGEKFNHPHQMHRVYRAGRVENFPRNSKNAWWLLLEALKGSLT